jgi:hypothetical protein
VYPRPCRAGAQETEIQRDEIAGLRSQARQRDRAGLDPWQISSRPHAVINFFHLKKQVQVRHLWLTPVILATQEAEIRRLKVRGQPWANSL